MKFSGNYLTIEYNSDCDFPIENLPYGIFIIKSDPNQRKTIGVAISDLILDLRILNDHNLIEDEDCVFHEQTLNAFMAKGKEFWTNSRKMIIKLLTLQDNKTGPLLDILSFSNEYNYLVKQSDVNMILPADIGDYTDFYSSREHATNVGTMFRGKDNALQPNWLHLPVGYHGRASSVVVSGTNLKRPSGQIKPNDSDPVFGPSKLVDFELEMGFFVGPGNELGEPIEMKDAENNIFGLVLLNDWSARDIQKWEYIPLGPFCGKNWGTSISPWVIPLDALEPFKVKSPDQTNPQILPYLQHDIGNNAYDINLSVYIQTRKMRDQGEEPVVLCKSNLKNMYWSIKQQLVHHSTTGCNMKPGDLCGSGTISGSTSGSYGSMLEITWKGTKPLLLPNGEVRKFLEDDDIIILKGYCQGNGYRIGFGECTGGIIG